MSTALTDLIIKTGTELARDTRTHPQTCECGDCETLLSIWLALDDEGHAQITEVWENSFAGCPVESDVALKREQDDLLALAINSVIAREDDEAWPDLSTQVVTLILTDDSFEPLRWRVFRSLFDC